MFALAGGYLVDISTLCKHTHKTAWTCMWSLRMIMLLAKHFQQYSFYFMLFPLVSSAPLWHKRTHRNACQAASHVYRYIVQCTYICVATSRISPFFCNGHVASDVSPTRREGKASALPSNTPGLGWRWVAWDPPRARATFSISNGGNHIVIKRRNLYNNNNI